MLSCHRLFGMKLRVYFWTFTFVNVLHEWEYGPRWDGFMRSVNRALGNRSGCGWVRGIRVIEPHERHGLHYHMLTTRRISIHLMRRVGRKYGIGRIGVERCNKGAAEYLTKYLGKSKSFATRIRSWGAVGGFRVCRVKDVQMDSAFHRNMRELFKGERTSLYAASIIRAHSITYGDLRDWPSQYPAQKAYAHHLQSRYRQVRARRVSKKGSRAATPKFTGNQVAASVPIEVDDTRKLAEKK